VLVVDDSVDSLDVVRIVLESRGHSVLTTSDPYEAIRMCRESDISLLISDLILHSPITGTDLALQSHELRPDAAILLMSGTAPEGWPNADFEKLGRFLPVRADFLQKPFTSNQLLAKVDTLMKATAPLPEFGTLIRDAERSRR